MSDIIRIPQQERSIKKKSDIIEAGYRLFAKDGYFNTNTAQIAKEAKVSTGIVYGYFHDKRDILIEVLDIYVENAFKPILEILDKLSAPIDFDLIVPQILEATAKIHKKYASIHETLHSLSSTDKLVNDKFIELEDTMTHKIASKLSELGYGNDSIYEDVHLAIMLIQSFSHEFVFDKHSYIDYNKMKSSVINIIVNLFKK